MNTFTVSLTDVELKALAYVAYSPQDWIDNVVHERCRIAIEEIFTAEVARMVADPSITQMPADLETFVELAEIKSLAERVAQTPFTFINNLDTAGGGQPQIDDIESDVDNVVES